ncbi:hypothetical protein HEM37_022525, partial [Escherichia coli]|uniref:conjugal transfer protein TraP n=1 Tax=Escherichia coli TaxID=562 RepID=UPI001DF1A8EC
MANNMSLRQICHATRYVVAQGLCWLFWCLKYAVILPLATMALLALLVLWKDNTTPGKLLVVVVLKWRFYPAQEYSFYF